MIKLIQSKNFKANYAAKIIRINDFRPHSDPEVTKLKCCTVDGFNIICGIDSEPGLYVYFPVMCQINPDFVSFSNLYRDSTKNNDTTQSGMFELNCRVKAIRLRGELSEGFIMPVSGLINYVNNVLLQGINISEETEFDTLSDDKQSIWLARKYVVVTEVQKKGSNPHKGRITSKVIEDQFRFHYDTLLIKKFPYILTQDQTVSITSKIHGTSAISAYVLCDVGPRTFWEKVVHFFNRKKKYVDYDYLYASRTVIKNESQHSGWYGEDVWAEADKLIKPHLLKGMTVYSEIVGYTRGGQYIQKGYDYGCVKPTNNEYIPEVHFKVRPYRITTTSPSGVVSEWSAKMVQEWCKAQGLIPVKELYYGKLTNLYPQLTELSQAQWSSAVIEQLSSEKKFYMEENSPECNNKVPQEGIVIKIEDGLSRAFKLKCFAFLNKEQKDLDNGISNMEDEA